MPILHIARTAPAMTRHLVEAGTFARTPLVVVDVGARGGVEPCWKAFGDQLRIIGFEPDPVECARLNETAEKNVSYLPVALSDGAGKKTFHVARLGAAGSFYKGEPAFNARLNIADNMVVEREVTIETTTLAAALGDIKPDFIKLDAEGAELEILRGADLGSVLGVVAEVRFGELMSGCPTFADTDLFCRGAGFQLYDLDAYRYSRAALPYPFLYDYRDDDGKAYPGPTIQGQTLTGDALYFRDGLTAQQPLKLACLFELFGLADCAAEVILAHDLDRKLLDLLTPEVEDRKLGYADYIGRSRSNDPMFRPTGTNRYPEALARDYDGKFTPRWRNPLRALQRLIRGPARPK